MNYTKILENVTKAGEKTLSTSMDENSLAFLDGSGLIGDQMKSLFGKGLSV